jgi:hypothetical protein
MRLTRLLSLLSLVVLLAGLQGDVWADRGWALRGESAAIVRIKDADPNPDCSDPLLMMWSLFDGTASANCKAGGSGGGGTGILEAKAATTANISNLSNPGTAVFDGVTLTAGDRLLVWFQTTQTENGLYTFATSSTPLVRSAEADISAEYPLHRKVSVLQGTLYGGQLFELGNTSPVTLGSSNLTFFQLALGTKSESTTRKSTSAAAVANGYVGADANGRVPWTLFGSFAQHANLAAGSTITPTAFTMGIQSSSGQVNLTTTPNIAAGTYHGQKLRLKGTHDSQTIVIDDETVQASSGVLLCGRTGSVILRLGFGELNLEWNAVLGKWEEQGCTDLDRVSKVARVITGATSTGTAVCLGQDANNCTRFYFTGGENRMESLVGGTVSPNSVIQLGAGGSFTVKKSDATNLFSQANDTGVVTGVSIDAEGTGNTLTVPRRAWRPAAGCNGAAASPIWDLPASNPAVAACVTGTNTQKGVLDFADGANLSAQLTEALPTTWTGAIDVRIKWLSATTSGNVVWQVATICVADAETDDPAFNTASTVTDATKGTTNQTNDAAITGLTTTGCAAGELLHLKVSRDSAHASDTMAGTARLIGVELTIRETL